MFLCSLPRTPSEKGSFPMSTEAPAGGPSGASAPHNYFYHTFPNGLQVVGQRMPSLSSITFGVQFGAGTKDEPTEQLGLAHLMESMMFQGTKSRNVRQLTEAFETLGARKGGSTSTETSTYRSEEHTSEL